jgi:hypothetical protein
LRQPRNYSPVNETHRQVDEQQNTRAVEESRSPSRQPRSYESLRESQYRVDEQQNVPTAKDNETPRRPEKRMDRSWTDRGGMVAQQSSANKWHEQNLEMRMRSAHGDKSGAERATEGTQPRRDQNDPALQRARHIAEQTRQREAADRSREHERSGPER